MLLIDVPESAIITRDDGGGHVRLVIDVDNSRFKPAIWLASIPGRTAEEFEANKAKRSGYLVVGPTGGIRFSPYS